MKKMYEVTIVERGCDDEWPELYTYDKEEALKHAEHQNLYRDEKYHCECRELEMPDDFDLEAFKDGDSDQVDIYCENYNYNVIND